MSVLDELRKTLGNDPHSDGWQTDDILSEIDAFEAAHPGLVEWTRCSKCHRVSSIPEDMSAFADAYTPAVCPACAEVAE